MDALYFTYQNACQLIIICVLRMISHMARLEGHLSNRHFLPPPEHVFYVVSRNRPSPEHAFYVLWKITPLRMQVLEPSRPKMLLRLEF